MGVVHGGMRNAKKVIAELDRRGIKKGDLVAWEETPELIEDLSSCNHDEYQQVLEDLKSEITRIEADLKKATGDDLTRLRELRDEWIGQGEMFVYSFQVYSFLKSKKARILPFGTEAVRSRTEEGAIPRYIKGIRRRKLISDYLAVPISEKHWRKNLKGRNPRFVLAGAGHLSTLKRMVPYEDTVDLSGRRRWRRIKDRVYGDSVRAHYRLINEAKKFRRRMKPKKRKKK